VEEEYSAPKEVWVVERNQMTQFLSGRQPVRPGRKEKNVLGKERGFVMDQTPYTGKADVLLRGLYLLIFKEKMEISKY